MNRRLWNLLPALFLLSAALAGCRRSGGEGAAVQEASPPVAVETAAVAAGEITEAVEVTGTLNPRYRAEIKSEVSGRVSEVKVTEWAGVRKGDPLAAIDASDLERQIERAKASLQAAQAAAQTARAGSLAAAAGKDTARVAVDTAKAGLAEAKVAADGADREYERLRKLKEAGLVTQQAQDGALTQRDAARARAVTVQAQIAAAEAQAAVAEAQASAAASQVTAAEAQAAVVREDIRAIETRLGKTVIRAPFDGTVAERLVNPGEVVGEMQKVIFVLVDNRLLDLTVSVPSGEMNRLRAGQTVEFSVDTFPGRTFTGRVSFINPSVSPADRSVRVTAEVANDPEVLKGGLYVTGRILTGTRSDVIRVPRSALFNWDVPAGRGDLYVVEGDVARRRTVEVGAVTGDQAEISKGLAAGELVVVRGGFNLKDGERVVAGGRK